MSKARDLADLINKINPEEASRLRDQIAQGYDELDHLNKHRGDLWAEIEALKNKIKQLNNERDYTLLQEVVELQNDISHLGMHLDDNPDELVFQEELDIRLDRYNAHKCDPNSRSCLPSPTILKCLLALRSFCATGLPCLSR